MSEIQILKKIDSYKYLITGIIPWITNFNKIDEYLKENPLSKVNYQHYKLYKKAVQAINRKVKKNRFKDGFPVVFLHEFSMVAPLELLDVLRIFKDKKNHYFNKYLEMLIKNYEKT